MISAYTGKRSLTLHVVTKTDNYGTSALVIFSIMLLHTVIAALSKEEKARNMSGTNPKCQEERILLEENTWKFILHIGYGKETSEITFCLPYEHNNLFPHHGTEAHVEHFAFTHSV